MTEVWKPVVGFEGLYEVSDQGRVRSLDRYVEVGRGRRFSAGRVLIPCLAGGYPRVDLCSDRRYPRNVHVLVARAFLGPTPPGHGALHFDGDKTNNRLANLRYGTQGENAADAARHGHVSRGETHPGAKLTEVEVVEAKRLARRGCYHREIAERFGVARETIGNIVRGQRWRHVP